MAPIRPRKNIVKADKKDVEILHVPRVCRVRIRVRVRRWVS